MYQHNSGNWYFNSPIALSSLPLKYCWINYPESNCHIEFNAIKTKPLLTTIKLVKPLN